MPQTENAELSSYRCVMILIFRCFGILLVFWAGIGVIEAIFTKLAFSKVFGNEVFASQILNHLAYALAGVAVYRAAPWASEKVNEGIPS